MAFADNNGIRIHYQTEGEGPPLLLHHGRGGSGDYWRYFGFVEELKRDYQLILMDASDLPPIALPLIISDSRPVEAWA